MVPLAPEMFRLSRLLHLALECVSVCGRTLAVCRLMVSCLLLYLNASFVSNLGPNHTARTSEPPKVATVVCPGLARTHLVANAAGNAGVLCNTTADGSSIGQPL